MTLAERWALNQDKKSGGAWEEVRGSESKSRIVLDEGVKEYRLLSSEEKGFSANKEGWWKASGHENTVLLCVLSF